MSFRTKDIITPTLERMQGLEHVSEVCGVSIVRAGLSVYLF